MSDIQTQKKSMSCKQSEGSTIVDYNEKFMNRVRVSEACGRTFQIPGAIEIILDDKHSGVVIRELDPTPKKAL